MNKGTRIPGQIFKNICIKAKITALSRPRFNKTLVLVNSGV